MSALQMLYYFENCEEKLYNNSKCNARHGNLLILKCPISI